MPHDIALNWRDPLTFFTFLVAGGKMQTVGPCGPIDRLVIIIIGSVLAALHVREIWRPA